MTEKLNIKRAELLKIIKKTANIVIKSKQIEQIFI
jgi:hypothetical protein